MSSLPPPASSDPAPGMARAGMVAVVGRASVGKSSLVNAILGEKVSIVSPVAQTTRNVIRGILTEPRGQLVFLDTPGIHKAQSDLGKLMNQKARAAAEGVDVVLLVLDSSVPPRDEDVGWMSRIQHQDVLCVACLNKLDQGGAHAEAYRQAWAEKAREKAVTKDPLWLGVSAQTGAGVPELVDKLFEIVPSGPLLFPADVLTDYPRKLAIADAIREKLFGELRDELPHAVAVWIENIVEQDDAWNVEAVIYVNKSSQKGIVLGEKGRRLRKVRRSAEGELKAIYERPVTLDLWIKVEKDWNRNFWMLKKLGYAG